MSRAADQLLTLHEAAALVPGATADTLKRRIRQGKLRAYRPGKAYLTTQADVLELVQSCRVQRVQDSGLGQLEQMPAENMLPSGLSGTEIASEALGLALERAKLKRNARSGSTLPKNIRASSR